MVAPKSLISLVLCALLVARSQAALPLSSLECFEEDTEQARVCIFYDVVLWEGQLRYVSADPNLALPRTAVHLGQRSDDARWYRPAVATPEALAGAGEPQALEHADEVLLYSSPPTLGRSWSAHLGQLLPTLHSAACEYLGRCTANATAGFRFLDVSPQASGGAWWVRDAFRCFSPADPPRLRLDDPALKGKVFLIKKAVAGIGPRCQGQRICGKEGGARPGVPAEQLTSYRRRLAECFGFDPERPAATDPVQILVVDRYYGSGGQMLNVGPVVDALQTRYASFANVTLHYMEDLTAAEQARAWIGASVVVHLFGSALASWHFLPKGAVAVPIPIHPDLRAGDDAHAAALATQLGPVSNMSHKVVDIKDGLYVHLKSDVLWEEPQWKGLAPEQRLGVMESGCAPLTGDAAMHGLCTQRWLRKLSNIAPPVETVVAAVDQAVKDLFAKRGKPLPTGFTS